MTSRCALLPFPGDPFLLNYWLKYYDKFWKNEVNKLYIYHNSSIEKEVEQYIADLCKRHNAEYIYYPEQLEHGEVIKRLLKNSKEQYIMLIEDDAIVFRGGAIDRCFKVVENKLADVVASKRGSCSQEILDIAKEKWQLNYEGKGDQGCNFWPCFFFADRSVFDGTDYNFGAKAWLRHEKIEPLGHVVQSEIVASDTFVNMSLQLRAKGLKFHYVNQYHASPDDIEHFNRNYNLWDSKAEWVHVGSLSSGVGGVLRTEDNRPLARKHQPANSAGEMKTPVTRNEKHEWERRVQWWLTFYENREQGKIKSFAMQYKEAIDRLISELELSINNIKKRQHIYSYLGL